MLEGLYSAAAGMTAQQQRIDGVSNDLANVNTTGYKGVRVGFRDLLYNPQGREAGATVTAGAGAAASFIGRSQAQGALQTTEQPLDLAIAGPGFFQVRTADGNLALTRDGAFRVDSGGRLCSSDGALVQPPIQLPQGTPIDRVAIGKDGTVRAAGQTVGRIQLVNVTAPDGLRPLGDNRFEVTAESGLGARRRQRHAGAAGPPRGLNVEMSDAMVDMINAQRAYQLASRAIHMQDQMMEIANQVKR